MNHVDRNEAFELALSQVNEELDVQFRETLDELFNEQQDVMDRVDNLVNRAADLHILQPQRELMEGYQGQVAQLRAVNADSQQALAARQGEVRAVMEQVASLHTDVVNLAQARAAVPPPRYQTLVALADHATQEISYHYRKGGK